MVKIHIIEVSLFAHALHQKPTHHTLTRVFSGGWGAYALKGCAPSKKRKYIVDIGNEFEHLSRHWR